MPQYHFKQTSHCTIGRSDSIDRKFKIQPPQTLENCCRLVEGGFSLGSVSWATFGKDSTVTFFDFSSCDPKSGKIS